MIFLLQLLFASPLQAEWYKTDRAIMGTAIHVELWHSDKKIANENIHRVIDEMNRIDSLMSPFKKDSELSLINKQASTSPLKISSELFNLIQQSINMSNLSNGAFDITFASIGYMYNYREKLKPTKKEISKNLKLINYKNIKLNKNDKTIFFNKAGMRIDLGGIAKGYAIDRSIELLKRHGITQAMVSAGGDTKILGDKNGRPWLVGIRHPRKKDKSSIVIPLKHTAISTSGDYERFFIKDGVRHHHIISPQTGQSARELQSVSIIGKDATTTDALSTSVFILGLNKGMKLISTLKGIEAIIIDNKNKIHYSSGLIKPSTINK